MQETAEQVLSNKGVRLLYFAVLLVLVVLAVWHLKLMSDAKPERMANMGTIGTGLPYTYQSIASGPTQKHASLFSMTNQGTNPVHNDDLLYAANANKERLSSMREAPVFYEISSELGQNQQLAQFNCSNGEMPETGVMTDANGVSYQTMVCRDGSNPARQKSGSATEHMVDPLALQEAQLSTILGRV
jgi:hypothetical protein